MELLMLKSQEAGLRYISTLPHITIKSFREGLNLENFIYCFWKVRINHQNRATKNESALHLNELELKMIKIIHPAQLLCMNYTSYEQAGQRVKLLSVGFSLGNKEMRLLLFNNVKTLHEEKANKIISRSI